MRLFETSYRLQSTAVTHSRIRTLVLLFLTSALFLLSLAPTFAADALVMVLRSEANASTYQDQGIGIYNDDWQAFVRILEKNNLRYDVWQDTDLHTSKLRPE